MTQLKIICNGYRCGEGPRIVLKGIRLCGPCARGLADDLAALPRLYDHCGQLLGGRDALSAAERTTGGPLPGLPFTRNDQIP